jgi:hypothetical protein
MGAEPGLGNQECLRIQDEVELEAAAHCRSGLDKEEKNEKDKSRNSRALFGLDNHIEFLDARFLQTGRRIKAPVCDILSCSRPFGGRNRTGVRDAHR